MICNECETVAHCMKHGCIPKQPAPVQEPALWLINGVVQASDIPTDYTGCFYTTPPAAQPAVPLTDKQIQHLVDTHVGGPNPSYPLDNSDWLNFARAIEAAHGIKRNT
jgi:hypothetical protein